LSITNTKNNAVVVANAESKMDLHEVMTNSHSDGSQKLVPPSTNDSFDHIATRPVNTSENVENPQANTIIPTSSERKRREITH
jgi:hypothetical protein